MVRIWPKFISILLTWAMKRAARASYKAVPSMLMVAPTGSTKRVMRLSMRLFSSAQRKVMGRVAELLGEREKREMEEEEERESEEFRDREIKREGERNGDGGKRERDG